MTTGNPSYHRFLMEPPTITVFNLAEIYWSAIQHMDELKADIIYKKYSLCVVQIPDEVIKEAMKLRKQNKKKNISYTDSIGYVYALKNNLKFLTGDMQFEHLPNVEFVK